MYSTAEQGQLLDIARRAIRYGLEYGSRPQPDAVIPAVSGQQPRLAENRATFVTLKTNGLLRGCIGNLLPRERLADSVANNAYSAAFHDPRFAPLREDEWPLLRIEISVLSIPEAMHFDSERDLLVQLQPGRDGLIIRAGAHSATFLPSVWEQLPDAEEFLNQLKRKAGLPANSWPVDITAERYSTFSFHD